MPESSVVSSSSSFALFCEDIVVSRLFFLLEDFAQKVTSDTFLRLETRDDTLDAC
jgi:hypothetical protein